VIASVHERLEQLIERLEQEICELDAEIATALQHDDAWAAAAARLATITGLGMLTIAWLLTTTVNFTLTRSPEAATNYAGLAPRLRHVKTARQVLRTRISPAVPLRGSRWQIIP
jgi:transposase